MTIYSNMEYYLVRFSSEYVLKAMENQYCLQNVMLCVTNNRLRQVATWFLWRVIVCDRSPRGLCGELSFTTGRHVVCVASYRLRQVATWFVWRLIVYDRSPRGLCGKLSFTTGPHVVCVASYRLRQVATWFVWRVIVYDRSPRGLCDIYFTEFGADLTTVLPVLFKYCCKYCYSDSQKLWAVFCISFQIPVYTWTELHKPQLNLSVN